MKGKKVLLAALILIVSCLATSAQQNDDIRWGAKAGYLFDMDLSGNSGDNIEPGDIAFYSLYLGTILPITKKIDIDVGTGISIDRRVRLLDGYSGDAEPFITAGFSYGDRFHSWAIGLNLGIYFLEYLMTPVIPTIEIYYRGWGISILPLPFADNLQLFFGASLSLPQY